MEQVKHNPNFTFASVQLQETLGKQRKHNSAAKKHKIHTPQTSAMQLSSLHVL